MKYSIPYFSGLSDFWKRNPALSDIIEEVYFDSGSGIFAKENHGAELLKFKKAYDVKLHNVMSRSVFRARSFLPNGVQSEVDNLKELRDMGMDRVTLSNSVLLRHMPARRALAGVEISTGILDEIKTLSQAQGWIERFDIDILYIHPDANRNADDLRKIKKFAQRHNVQVCLLANEGCLPRCPFRKQEADMFETLENIAEDHRESVVRFFNQSTCAKIYAKRPEAVLQSPFLLPEMFESLEDKADSIRFTGPCSSPVFYEKLLTSLLEGKTGELRLYGEYLPRTISQTMTNITLNDLSKVGFANDVENCAGRCADCDFCLNVYKKF